MVFAVGRYIIPSDSVLDMDTLKNKKVNQIYDRRKNKTFNTR